MPHDAADQRSDVTPEVGDEGGTPGDIQITIDRAPAAGSEGTETWRPADPDIHETVRGENG